MKKNFPILLLSILLLFSMVLSACGPAEETPTESPALEETKEPAEPKTEAKKYDDLAVIEVEPGAKIVFSGWGDETEQQIYRDTITRFNEFYPDVPSQPTSRPS